MHESYARQSRVNSFLELDLSNWLSSTVIGQDYCREEVSFVPFLAFVSGDGQVIPTPAKH